MLVHVYWNIRKHCWSIRDARTRRVVQHRSVVALTDCVFHVSEAGRQRVLAQRRRNVHAWVEGALLARPDKRRLYDVLQARRVSYNPYDGPTFLVSDREPIVIAPVVFFDPMGGAWV